MKTLLNGELIKARHRKFKTGLDRNKIIQYIVIDRLLVSHRFGIIRYLDFLQDIAVFHTLDCYRLFSDITSLKTERWTQHIVSTLFIIVFNTPSACGGEFHFD
jgi:hypothetical protein